MIELNRIGTEEGAGRSLTPMKNKHKSLVTDIVMMLLAFWLPVSIGIISVLADEKKDSFDTGYAQAMLDAYQGSREQDHTLDHAGRFPDAASVLYGVNDFLSGFEADLRENPAIRRAFSEKTEAGLWKGGGGVMMRKF